MYLWMYLCIERQFHCYSIEMDEVGWPGGAGGFRGVRRGPAGSGGGCHGDKGSSATQSAVAPASSPRPPILPFLLKQHIHLAPSQSNQLSNENPMRIQ